MSLPSYEHLSTTEIGVLAAWFESGGTRRVREVHVHHTFMPNQRVFDALAIRLGSGLDAGLECCRRMWRFHTESLGWSDIAQHVTIDPEGRIWLNRRWDRAPASAPGFNGSGFAGPFMIEMIGDFDHGRETPTPAQREATIATIVALQSSFELTPDRFRFHNEMSPKSCPGSALGRDGWLAEITEAHRKSTAKRPSKAGSNGAAPTAASARLARLFNTITRDESQRSVVDTSPEANAELPESDMTMDAYARLSRAEPDDGRPFARGSDDAAPELTNEMLTELKRHVVNVPQGRLTPSGDFTTTLADLERLVGVHLVGHIERELDAGRTPRVLLHAHGGLNNETAGLRYAFDLHRWWLAQGVYPVFFVWETGAFESIMQLLQTWLSDGSRGPGDAFGELRDRAVEALIREIGTPLWDIMKRSAERASDGSEAAGASVFASLLDAMMQTHADAWADVRSERQPDATGPLVEFHAVAHSAGAIFQIEFLKGLRRDGRSLALDSLSLLAPACTVELFHAVVPEQVESGHIGHVAIYNLDRRTERDDPTVPFYGKSLLHLVSDGFEGEREVPILGMTRFVDDDRRLQRFLGRGIEPTRQASLVIAPTGAEVDPRRASGSKVHGGFSREPDTLRSVAMRVRGLREPDAVPPLSSDTGRQALGGPLFEPIEQRLDRDMLDGLFPTTAVAQTSPPAPSTDVASPATSAPVANTIVGPFARPQNTGRRLALCIGIDAYEGPITPLRGCVNDAEDWSNCLDDLGFSVSRLPEEETTQQGLVQAIGALVQKAAAGDLVVIHYSGHGIRLEDLGGDDEDMMDEALVPIDSFGKRFVSDDELWDLLAPLDPNARLYVFMDCCHSQSNTRAPLNAFDGTPRLVTPTREMIEAHRQRRRDAGVQIVAKSIETMNHIKYAACLDSEFAMESNGRGRFSVAATRAIRGLQSGVTNHELLVEIEQAFAGRTDQHPGLECPTAWKRHAFMVNDHIPSASAVSTGQRAAVANGRASTSLMAGRRLS